MRATIHDVAREAGVSVATVSRVVNGNYPVRDETRKRVAAAIQQLQYVPNMQARELNMRRSTSIGVVVPGLYNMFFAEVIDGVEDYLRRGEYSLLLCCAKNDPQQEMKCVTDLMSRNVSGIIVISPNTEHVYPEFYEQVQRRQALVFINSYTEQLPDVSRVNDDAQTGTRQALAYLLQQGHRRILFVRGENSDSYRVKEKAYVEFMQENGLLQEEDIVNIGEGNSTLTVDHTAQEMLSVLAASPATAVLCCNDLMAVGVLHACRHLNRPVPESLSVIGYDNISLGHFITPQLTTVDQHMFRLGSSAAQLLIERIETGASHQLLLKNDLVLRETTAECLKEK